MRMMDPLRANARRRGTHQHESRQETYTNVHGRENALIGLALGEKHRAQVVRNATSRGSFWTRL